jgi:hypothetical protein
MHFSRFRMLILGFCCAFQNCSEKYSVCSMLALPLVRHYDV